jgi:ferredoxin
VNLDSLVTWAAHFGEGECVELHCAEQPDPGRGHRGWKPVRAPGCVADLGLEVPLELFALGVARIAVRRDGCATPAALESRLARWETLFAMAGRALEQPPAGRSRREVMEASNMPTVERRSLFGLGRKAPRDEGAWRPDVAATGQRRLRDALRRLGARPTAAGNADGVGWRIVTDGCRAAGQCATACPNDALRLTHAARPDGTQRSLLLFDASLCNACGRCVEFCDADAIRPDGATSFNDLVTAAPTDIAALTTRGCERCRSAFVPGDDGALLCAVCTARRGNPFGSVLPPEALARLQRTRGDSAP